MEHFCLISSKYVKYQWKKLLGISFGPSLLLMVLQDFLLISYLKKLVFFIGLQDDRDLSKLETLVWDPNNPLQDQHIDQFLVIARYNNNN